MAPSKQDAQQLELGKINGFWGVNGWLKVFSYTDPKEDITQYKKLNLHSNGSMKSLQVEQARMQAKTIVIKFVGYDSREQAEALLGSVVSINKQDLPELEEDEFYWHELIGLNVFNLQQKQLGIVDSMLATQADDVLVIKSADAEKREYLIPFVMEYFVCEVDLENRRIIVDWEFEQVA